MASTLNKQPIFTATPILVSLGMDVPINTSHTNVTNKCTVIYEDTSGYGSLITRITVKANAILETKVSSKRVDLYILLNDSTTEYGLYQSKYMVGIEPLTASDEVPSVVFEFPEGLIIKPGKKLALSVTENADNSGSNGDLVSIVIEGGTYDQP